MNGRTRIKICGLTTPREAAMAVDAGADAVGVILAPSPRRVSFERAREIVQAVPAFVSRIGVFVDPPADEVEQAVRAGFLPQFCGDESPEFCERHGGGSYIRVFHVDPQAAQEPEVIERFAERHPRATLLFDTRAPGARGGTGTTFAWEAVRAIAARRRVIVSGGLTPENVGACVRSVRPYAVDVRSGVERGGVKDPERVSAFVRAVREADAES
jgi:phosphoribosylanthranilate isomerase